MNQTQFHNSNFREIIATQSLPALSVFIGVIILLFTGISKAEEEEVYECHPRKAQATRNEETGKTTFLIEGTNVERKIVPRHPASIERGGQAQFPGEEGSVVSEEADVYIRAPKHEKNK